MTNVLLPGRDFQVWTAARMLSAAALLALLCIHQGHSQSCTEGFDYDRRARQCVDVDECRSLPDPCRGDMVCVNQNGGYLCMPRGMYSQSHRPAEPYRPEPYRPEPYRPEPYPQEPYPQEPYRPPAPEPYRPEPYRPEPYPYRPRAGAGPPPEAPPPPYPDTSLGFVSQGPVEPSYPRIRPNAPCILGYAVDDNGVCHDIDECEANSHQCNPTQVCINTEGGYTCSCTEGYWLVTGQCQDIDECRYGYCQQLCANTVGSYSCSCRPGFVLNGDQRTCQDVDECEEEPCSHGCLNSYGSFMCNCVEGFELAADGTTCMDVDECGYTEFLCQHRCVNTPGSFSCVCPPGYYVFEDERSCEDINECDTGNNTCTTAQVCFNFQGGFTCLDPLQCETPYIEVADNQCMCSAENRECRDKPFTILFRHMDLSSGRTVPASIFQMQATTRYPGAFYIFKVKSGDGDRVFYMRQTSNVSATLVLSRPVTGPQTMVLDLEMTTVNNVINFRGSSIIRLTIFVSEHPF